MADDPPVHDDEAPPPVVSVVSASEEHPEESWQQWYPPPHPAVAMAQYYQDRMRAHAAEYASAAAGAAWAAAQIAASSSLPPTLPPVPYYQQPWHPPPQVEHARPGKRQQIMPAAAAAAAFAPVPWQRPPPSRNELSAKRGRRRMRSSDTNSSDSRSLRKHDRSLLGKTGVSALHEWCDKRKLMPKFIPKLESQGFVVSVELDGRERGRGRGGTKGIAKQEAARQALQSLLPGVVFDATGILVELPAVEDLALSQLAIGEESKKRQPSSRTWDYLGTSTTSEEDNDYYASRGASVCSALLHAMWQIDDLIPEPPSYTYEVCAAAKRKGVAGSTAVAIHRSSFACTARLFVKTPLDNEKSEKKDDAESTGEVDDDYFEVKTLSAVGTAATKREARHVASAKLLAMLFPECNGMVEVKAAAEATREKYAASKALKMQSRRGFANDRDGEPSKLPRKRSIDFATPHASDPPLPDYLSQRLCAILGHEMNKGNDVNTADDGDEVSVESLSLSEKVATPEKATNKEVRGAEGTGRTFDGSAVGESVSRSLSRKKQLDERVDSALQLLNELDDEGRSLPEELNSNDVGRTVLRRAETEDAVWIQQLLSHQDERPMRISQSRWHEKVMGPFALVGVSSDALSAGNENDINSSSEQSSLSSRLWGSTAITLLLCRAISPKDDPPLGCAVLTLGFSTKKGQTLRIAELVSEPHLPKERFIECLGKFAHHMKCALENELKRPVSSLATVFSTEQLKSILEAHLAKTQEEAATKVHQADNVNAEILDLKTIGASLQSVQEEETEVEDDKEKEEGTKGARRGTKGDKPSKRSRVV